MFDKVEHDPYRPSELLRECMNRYGLAKNRRTTTDNKVVSYVRVEEYIDFEWESRWVLGGVSESPAESLSQAFTIALRIMRESSTTRIETTKVNSFVVVTHGTGKCAFMNPNTDELCEYSELPEEAKQQIDREANHDLHKRVRREQELPTRVVNIITPTGLAADVSIWLDDEVFVDTCEEWVFDGEGTVPKGGGAIDDALMGTMTFVTLVYEAVRTGNPLTIEGLIKTAFETSDDAQLTAHLMRIVATGIEVGLLNETDFSDDIG